MATERGIVVSTGAGVARVRTLPQEACAGCPSCGSCSGQRESAEMEVVNEIGAAAGDRILMDLDHRAFLKVTFLLYVVPIIALLAGAAAGLRLSQMFAWGESATSALCGFLAFGIAVYLIRFLARRMAADRAYRARITRVLPESPNAAATVSPEFCERAPAGGQRPA